MDALCRDKHNTEYQEMLRKGASFCGELKWRSSSRLFPTSWKNVFCVIHQGRMYAYENQSSSPPSKVFNLRAVEIYENQQIPHSFELKTTGDDCQFVASSEASKQSWIEALHSKNQHCADGSDYEILDDSDYDRLEVETICPVLRTEVNASTWSGTPRNQYKSSTKESSGSRTHQGHSSLKHHQAIAASTPLLPKFISQSNPGKSEFEKALWLGEAERAQKTLLYIKSNGTFMIRNSSTRQSSLKTLLVLYNGIILKYSIAMSQQGKCLMSGQEFQTGDDLIEYFTKNYLPDYPVKLIHPYYNAPVRDKS